jgi:predicted transcriptional regulator of viral defense system
VKLQILIKKKIVFTTHELAFELGKATSSVSRSLQSLYKEGEIQQVTRGIWANTDHPYFTPYALTPLLLNHEQGYVSFLSALHRHDIISQIPTTIQIATSGRNRIVSSPVGDFEFIKMSPEIFQDGFSLWGEVVTYNLATKEKALFDCLYISTRKGKRFSKFPEVDLSSIKKKILMGYLNQLVSSKAIKSAITSRFSALLEK